MRFMNRKKEVRLAKAMFMGEPNCITFVCGPKSCGKSLVLMKARDELLAEKKKVKFYWYNLRREFMPDYQSFVDLFFKDEKLFEIEREEKIVGGASAYIFKAGAEVVRKLKVRDLKPFDVMEAQIKKDIMEGCRVNLVVDELQALRDIYLNEKRKLIDSMLNFFVSLTKMDKIANVICATSETFFIDELWHNSKLQGAAEYWWVDWVPEIEVEGFLEEDGFTKDEINYLINRLGGYTWAVMQVVKKKNEGKPVKQTVDEIYQVSLSQLKDLYLNKQYPWDEIEKILKVFVKDDKYVLQQNSDMKAIRHLVENEILFYDPVGKVVSPHSKTTLLAIRELVGRGQGAEIRRQISEVRGQTTNNK